MSDDCKHLQLIKLDDKDPSNRLHNGPEKAYLCRECGSIFFVNLKPAEITVHYGKPPQHTPSEGAQK